MLKKNESKVDFRNACTFEIDEELDTEFFLSLQQRSIYTKIDENNSNNNTMNEVENNNNKFINIDGSDNDNNNNNNNSGKNFVDNFNCFTVDDNFYIYEGVDDEDEEDDENESDGEE